MFIKYRDTFNWHKLKVGKERCSYFFRLIVTCIGLFQVENEVSGGFQFHCDVLLYFTSTKRLGLSNCSLLIKCYGELRLMHMKLSYWHKSSCYSQCSRDEKKGIAVQCKTINIYLPTQHLGAI